jgi:hypothetical protein
LTFAINSFDDIRLKALVVKTSQSDHVWVTAHTVLFVNGSEKEISGYDVWCKPFTEDDNLNNKHFDRKSSPTTDSISSGKYLFWSEIGDKRSQTKPFECGDDGRDHRQIDLDAVQ